MWIKVRQSWKQDSLSSRYTKALEVIKKLHKEQAQQVKEYKLKLDHLQTLKDAAFKVTTCVASLQAT